VHEIGQAVADVAAHSRCYAWPLSSFAAFKGTKIEESRTQNELCPVMYCVHMLFDGQCNMVFFAVLVFAGVEFRREIINNVNVCKSRTAFAFAVRVEYFLEDICKQLAICRYMV
jgi:hypothetical protein